MRIDIDAAGGAKSASSPTFSASCGFPLSSAALASSFPFFSLNDRDDFFSAIVMFPSVAERMIFFARVENAAGGGGQIVEGLNMNPYGAKNGESAIKGIHQEQDRRTNEVGASILENRREAMREIDPRRDQDTCGIHDISKAHEGADGRRLASCRSW